jgi:hypothetical protein
MTVIKCYLKIKSLIPVLRNDAAKVWRREGVYRSKITLICRVFYSVFLRGREKEGRRRA